MPGDISGVGQGFSVPSVSTDQTIGSALKVASDGCNEINAVLADIQGGGAGTSSGNLNASNILGDTNANTGTLTGRDVLNEYHIDSADHNVDITQASGAMVIDDLMQKISTKVQVAAQLLSTANNINKTVSRIMSQG